MSNHVFETGSTIRVKAQFTDWVPEGQAVGDPVQPESAEVNMYNTENVLINGPAIPTNVDVGLYHYYWTLPDEPGSYYIEFKGVVNGRTQLRRVKIKTKWNVQDSEV